MQSELNLKLKNLPKVDQVLEAGEIKKMLNETSREVVVDAVRKAIGDMREAVLKGLEIEISAENAAAMALGDLKKSDARSLRPVINATGVILHTNLGRARLAESSADAASSVSVGYSTLEFDLGSGKRGSRHDHISSLISAVTGAEAAIAVNNNAAATLLCLATVGAGREIPVSRGELVEIGGAFRIPDIMELGGTSLREVGTTNKTHLYDYEKAVNDNTAAILKVHTSNYRIMGFTEDVSCRELAELAHSRDLPMIYDIGSGLMVDLHTMGLDEPTVPQALRDGADIVLFSGDKLLGGPQAGIIAGKKRYIDAMKAHPLARVMRLDKMTLAALEETFRIYRDTEEAKRRIPVLGMITRPVEEVRAKAENLAADLNSRGLAAEFAAVSSIGRVGGGSAPMLNLKSWEVSVAPRNISVDCLAERLRGWTIPVIAHIQDGALLLDMRTVSDEEMFTLAKALNDVLI